VGNDAKPVLVSLHSTRLSNLPVGMPTDLPCHAKDNLNVTPQRRFKAGDACFETLKQMWLAGTGKVLRELPLLARWRRLCSGGRRLPARPGLIATARSQQATEFPGCA